MTLNEAYEILGIKSTASEAERHAAFEAKQKALEAKLGKAPTPGLKEKYRQALKQLEEAIEVVELSEDGGLLPSLAPECADSDVGLTAENTEAAEEGKEVKPIAKKSAKKVKQSFGKEIAVMVAVCLLMAGAAFWWFGMEQPKRAAEVARIEAEAQAVAEAEASRLAEIQATVTVDLNQLRLAAERLEGLLGQEQNKLRDLKSAESGRARDGEALRKAYDTIRRSRQEDYVEWLSDFERLHPVKLSIRTAEDFMRANNLQAAAKSVTEGMASIEGLDTEISQAKHARYGSALADWILGKDEKAKILQWLRLDEPKVVARAADDLRAELTYLNEATGKSNVLARLDGLALLAGEQDTDCRRWLDKVLPNVKIESVPSGASVISVTGRELGKTPLLIQDLRPGDVRYDLSLNKYKGTSLRMTALLNGEDFVRRVSMEKESGPEAGRNWTVGLGSGEKIELIYVKPSSFTLGSPEDEAGRLECERQHEVTLTHDYWLGKYEVTQGQWKALMGNNPSYFQNVDLRVPVEKVSWTDVMSFCRKLTTRERAAGRLPHYLEYTLPTEALWEYACRAGTKGPYAGSRLGSLAWYNRNSGDNTHPVGGKRANAWGFYDMHGNVEEWCSSWSGDYPRPNYEDPHGDTSENRRVARGGSCLHYPDACRSASRNYYREDDYISLTTGFRLALVPVNQ